MEPEEPKTTSRRSEFIRALADRHGAIGLGLVAPWIIGGPPTALLGVALGLRERDLVIGLTISLTISLKLFMTLVHAALR